MPTFFASAITLRNLGHLVSKKWQAVAVKKIGNCNVHALICDGVIDVSVTQLHLLLLWLNKRCSSRPPGSASGSLVGKE